MSSNATLAANVNANIVIRPSELTELLSQTIPQHMPVLVVGKPGAGKSSIIEASSLTAKADCFIVHPVVDDPTDYKGMPTVTKLGKDGKPEADFIPFGNLARMINAKKLTVVFIDDLGQASELVQAALMQLLLARQINGHMISPNVVFVAASNRRSDRAGVKGILEVVKSRFATIVELQTSPKDWRKWARDEGNIEPEVIEFIGFRPEALDDFKPTGDMTNSPSPRMWEFVNQHLTKVKYSSQGLLLAAIAGAVGKGYAQEFVGFRRVWKDLAKLDLILTNPETAPIATEPSARWATMTALPHRVEKESIGRYLTYMDRLINENQGSFAAVSLKTLMRVNPKMINTNAYARASAGPIGQLMVGGSDDI